MPDIFWMHTNQILYYSDFGMLADVTDLGGGQVVPSPVLVGVGHPGGVEHLFVVYVGMQANDWCPKQAYFAETAPGTAFFSTGPSRFPH